MDIEDKLTLLDTAEQHLTDAYRILAKLKYTGLANSVLELCDEVSIEINDLELDIEE